MKSFKGVITACCILLLSACSADISQYKHSELEKAADAEQAFNIQNYFNGDVTAWGTVQDYTNKVTRRFCVEIQGSWQGNNGVLAEKFYFDDGEISYRNWKLSKQLDGSYQGTAEDVSGIAIGIHQGFAFQFTYQLLLELDGSTYEVAMDDWMYQLDEHRVMNKTSMSKLGIEVAQITLFFDKELPVKKCS